MRREKATIQKISLDSCLGIRFQVKRQKRYSVNVFIDVFCLQFLIWASPNAASHVLGVFDEGDLLPPDWFSFTPEALLGLFTVSTQPYSAKRTVVWLATPLFRSFCSLCSQTTRKGDTPWPAKNRCADDDCERHNAAEQETKVCRRESLLANQSHGVDRMQKVKSSASCLDVVRRCATCYAIEMTTIFKGTVLTCKAVFSSNLKPCR